jgi:precorrin-3B synthase
MNAPLRRGACPGLSAPMQTGDGLLVRLLPIGTIPLAAFAGLCTAARTHGNGIVEVTARGSIQVRGLSASSAPRFGAAVSALGIVAKEGIPIHVNPLSGLDAEEILDAGALAADLRRALLRKDLAARLSPKVSVAIDGGSALGLDDLSADIRLGAKLISNRVVLQLSIGGDGKSAAALGIVAPENATDAAIRLLEVIAQKGRDARAHDILVDRGIAPFQQALSSCPALCRASAPYDDAKDVDGRDKPGHDAVGTRSEALGLHHLRDGLFACGFGLAFGHTDASSLEYLAAAAAAIGASGVRTAPGRTLIVVGLGQHTLSNFTGEAERLGFITRADDPRRHVVACAGAPICASAHIAARAMAPSVAESLALLRGVPRTIHISGCAKGCAHPAAATLTIVGTPDGAAFVANGAARDTPFAIVPLDQLPVAIAAAIAEAVHV